MAAKDVGLKEHFEALLAEMDRRYEQRADAQSVAVAAAVLAQEKAILKSEAAYERRFESVNEFRQTLSDQAGSFISRAEFEAVRETYAERIREVSGRLDRTEGRSNGLSAGWGFLVGAVGLAAAVIAIVINLQQ